MKFQRLHVLSLFIISSCTSPVPQGELPVVLINGDDEQVTMGLSEFADDFEIIPLETNDKALIGTLTIGLIHSKYLIMIDQGGLGIRLLQFDRAGIFLREMGSPGKGPRENGGAFLGS